MAGKEIEKAFEDTTKIIFGKALSKLDNYEEWLTTRVTKGRLRGSTTSRKKVYVPTYGMFRFIPDNLVSDLGSFTQLSKLTVNINESDTLATISKKLPKIATFIIEFEDGTNLNVESSSIYKNLVNAYKMVDCFYSKNLAYSFFSDKCENIFGVSKSIRCNFCVNVHDSRDVVRSFEVDFSKSCADVMFCHNCDNVKESLFCFNAKNLRYAIANTVVGRETYTKARAMLIEYILKQLEKTHKLDLDIYNVGCWKE